MAWEKFAKLMQLTGAVLGIPVAAAGVYSVYNTYFSTATACLNLRNTILSTMERTIPGETKAILIRKDIAEFEKACGKIDPDARSIFTATLEQLEAAATPPAASGAAAPAKSRTALPTLTNFDKMPGDRRGWAALGRRDAAREELNFAGLTASMPADGAVLTARWPIPVWTEPPAGRPDLTAARALIAAGTCVRVLSSHASNDRIWVEVVPALCS
jgi:hypothetical protein